MALFCPIMCDVIIPSCANSEHVYLMCIIINQLYGSQLKVAGLLLDQGLNAECEGEHLSFRVCSL